MTDTTAPDLLPCPFCGGTPSLRDDPSIPNAAKIGCLKIGCFGFDHWDPEKSVAISRWNTRAPVAAVKVKPLEWSGALAGGTMPSFYHAERCSEGVVLSRVFSSGETRSLHDDEADAKAAAQADYERRILSTLELAPAQPEAQTGAENDMERDAARYRWLRARDFDTIHHGGVFAGLTPDNIILNGSDLDEAVDAAMGGTE